MNGRSSRQSSPRRCERAIEAQTARARAGSSDYGRCHHKSCATRHAVPLAQNPLANLPFVIDTDGTVVTQSNACLSFLGNKFSLMGSTPAARSKVSAGCRSRPTSTAAAHPGPPARPALTRWPNFVVHTVTG